jgi:hypothetical protein
MDWVDGNAQKEEANGEFKDAGAEYVEKLADEPPL